jgi:hypothetical protein
MENWDHLVADQQMIQQIWLESLLPNTKGLIQKTGQQTRKLETH